MEYPAFGDVKILLASKSPRRRALLKELGVKVEIIEPLHENEEFPSHLKAFDIPLYLAREKAKSCKVPEKPDEILLTADTIVWLNGQVIEKPQSIEHAAEMLHRLSGNMHEVFTGVCLSSCQNISLFYDTTRVYFKALSNAEIDFYLTHYKPLDKAGAYGIQEWIGFIGVEKIEGSYFNVMGLPIHKVYQEITKFIGQ